MLQVLSEQCRILWPVPAIQDVQSRYQIVRILASTFLDRRSRLPANFLPNCLILDAESLKESFRRFERLALVLDWLGTSLVRNA